MVMFLADAVLLFGISLGFARLCAGLRLGILLMKMFLNIILKFSCVKISIGLVCQAWKIQLLWKEAVD